MQRCSCKDAAEVLIMKAAALACVSVKVTKVLTVRIIKQVENGTKG